MFRKLVLLLVSTIGLFSSAIYAVGLGEYKLSSGLNQPLTAEIKLLSAGDLGEHEVFASLASAAEFEKVGVERAFLLNNIRFATKKNENGSITILLSSREPIKEPFLNFLVELNWPNGRIIREYTFLLDPPIFEESTSSTIQNTQVQATPKAEPKAPQTRVTQPQNQTNYTGSTYGPVTATDTLWSIASKVRPNSQTSIHQTLVAIYRANPEAFANGNINNLLRGAVLKIPDANSVAQVPHRAALQDVVMQNRQWQSGGARNIVENTQNRKSSKNLKSEARLSLATPESKSVDQKNGSGNANERLNQIENQLISSQETSATLQAENEELRVRLADALKKLETVQSDAAVSISDTELAILTQPKTSNDNSELNLGVDSNSAELSENTVDDDPLNATSESELVNNSENESVSETESSVDQTASTAVVDKKITAPVFEPKVEKGFFEEMIDSGTMLWVGLALILLIVFAVFWRMRQRMEDEEFQDDLVSSSGASALDSNDSFELPDVGDDMMVELDMDDDEQSDDTSSEENFDPLGEADIYIAYGKYEQAEHLLLESIEDNPIRSDLKVKLMECYAENDDREKFESLAEEVATAIDADEWLVQIDTLRDQAWSGDTAEAGFDLPSTEDIFGASELDSEIEDFSKDDEFANTEEEIVGDDFSLDDADEDEFDIDMDLQEDDSSSAVTETFDALDDDDFSIEDIEADLDEDDAAIELADSDDISLDLDDDEFSFDEESGDFDDEEVEDDGDEISTKLDLARAYIDMGDSDGAKEILSEVISEGSEVQQQEAKALLEKAN